jgi:hypothetical protein
VNEAVIEIHKTADRSYAAIRETNAQLIAGIVEPTREIVRELKPALVSSTAAIAKNDVVHERVQKLIDAMIGGRPNGHG